MICVTHVGTFPFQWSWPSAVTTALAEPKAGQPLGAGLCCVNCALRPHCSLVSRECGAQGVQLNVELSTINHHGVENSSFWDQSFDGYVWGYRTITMVLGFVQELRMPQNAPLIQP